MTTLTLAMAAAACVAAALAEPTRAAAAEYVVDQAHARADDANSGTTDMPFRTIGKGLAVAQPGDTVLVKAGVYRETVAVKTSGTEDKPITLKGAADGRVIVSGADRITGWRPCTPEDVHGNPGHKKIYVTELDWPFEPQQMIQDERPLVHPRWPAEGWFAAEGGDTTTLVDARNLTQPAGYWDGATLVFRYAPKPYSFKMAITAYDSKKHQLTHAETSDRKKPVTAGADTYCMTNAPSILSGPGQWAVDTRQKPYRVYVWPYGDTDPNTCVMESPVRGGRADFVVGWGAGVGHVTFDGLEICHARQDCGIGSSAQGGHDVQIVNCVLINAGVRLYQQTRCTLRRSIQAGCRDNGVMITSCKNCAVEQCEVFGNGADAISVSHGSDGCRVSQCYIHDQWKDFHPDGLQTYRTTLNLTIEDNVLFNCGQGFMMQETDGGVFRNNIIAGTHHSGMILGYENTDNWDIDGNTFAFTTMTPLVITGRGTRVRNNIVLAGGDNNLIQLASKSPVECDWNLIWAGANKAAIQAIEKTSPHSRFGDPKFRSAPALLTRPVFYINQWGANAAVSKCTPNTLYLMGTPLSQHFAVGDHIEANFDGQVRTVTAVADDHITFDPPLKALHPYGWDVVVNWKDRTDFVWDLRAVDGGPAHGMGESGRSVGATLDIRAYQRGDFDGDGKRDLPDLPASALYDRAWSE